MKRGYIFDLDGTLVDSLAGIAASLNHALGESGLAVHPIETVRRFVGNGARILIERGAHPETDDAILGTLETAFKSHYDLHWPAGTAAYAGVTEMLEALQSQGHVLGVLSNKPHPFTAKIVELTFPSIRFDAVLGQRAGIPHKPEPDGALEIAAIFGLPAESCAVIGDSTIDIETARNAGMEAVAVTWGFHDREPLIAAGADFLADDMDQLQTLLTNR